MDFTSAKKKRRDLLEKGIVPHAQRVIGISGARAVAPTLSEKEEFYKQLAKGKTKPAVLSLLPEHNNAYVPQQPTANLPKPLTTLFAETNMKLSYIELLSACAKVTMEISPEECKAVEVETRDQADCRLWFSLRAGRITASRLKAACHTDPAKPSKSLVKIICYPEAHKFSSAATKYGLRMSSYRKLLQKVYSTLA